MLCKDLVLADHTSMQHLTAFKKIKRLLFVPN